ncbi:aldehyde:ferredoxin oxidoreductase [Candidatus Bathyarchaeota archaeon]|nr:aldehyde:ferredoxin oxidoreductase [Candidatus Bathyarchaeota archaeon]MBS7613231.1 aldehyde:ferredoxin oxidoreductase [Candidatus Bathyarchaeota archaeon]
MYGKVLHIDLSRKRSWVDDESELFINRIGGVGVGIKLLEEELPKGVDPLDPENVIVFTVGPLTGLYPMASKTIALFKSPLTGNLGESHAGGRSAIAIKSAGYEAIVVKGASETPIYVAVHGEKVFFRDASGLWGVGSSLTVGRVIREREPGAGIRSIMRIGVAGEKLVRYACVTTETYRHFGRLGLGAVFGSKKLKALVVSGAGVIQVKDVKLYRTLYDEIFNATTRTAIMRKYHDIGTSMNVSPLNEIGGLPTRNLKEAKFEGAEKISGDFLAENYLGRRVACSHCPVACIHLAALREPYEDEPYFYKTTMISYDYELIYALGSLLGISNTEGMLRLFHEVEVLGTDAISTGVLLAWMTEVFEKGLISETETAGLKPKWGDWKTYLKSMRFLVEQPTEFYRDLSMGVAYASNKYGGSDYALSFGGNEMPGYHTGPVAHIGFLTGARHSHLDSAGYSLDQKLLKEDRKPSVEEVVDYLLEEEAWRQILSSLVVCFFARGIYSPTLVVDALKSVGYEFSPTELAKLGLDILRDKNRFKLREGFRIGDLKPAKRIYETASPLGCIDDEFIGKAVNLFYARMGI